jgi:peptide chain release factor 1
MFDKLELLDQRYIEIENLMSSPEVFGDLRRLTELQKEHKEMSELVETYRAYKRAEQSSKEAYEIISAGDDELKELAREEFEASKKKMQEYADRLKILLLPKDPNDEKNVVIEIRSGAGGEEAALFAAVLYRMYSMYADIKNWNIERIYANETELGGFKEVSFLVNGAGAYSRLKFESGVHRVQRVPDTEASGRIHTSTVTVAVLPEAEEIEVEINPNDLQIDTFRSGGAGGQHVNKTESAIRITHISTGIVVECQDERSQHKNRERAMKLLRSKLYDKFISEKNAEIAAERRSQVGTGDRSERIRTYNYQQGRVTDHRIGLTLYKLENFLNGEIDEIIDALIAEEQASKLRASEQ